MKKRVPRKREENRARQRSVSPDGARLGAILRGTIEDQIAANDPPEVAGTLQRLLGEGLERSEAVDLLAVALTAEIFEVMTKRREFDRARYSIHLARLPESPPDSDA